MDKHEFGDIRLHLQKTQNQMAQLLGTSSKAIQSFEQGWRNIPPHAERQAIFLLAMKRDGKKKSEPCWRLRGCPKETKESCPAWEFRMGHLCWFINGTFCGGKPQGSWKAKMKVCRKCDVFLRSTGL
jgi:DNA-binding XRE family transcriptional regulator